MERHYGMDWLRIGAFGLLIFYHIGMVFVPWGFHLKVDEPLIWAQIPMYLTSSWRLTLLFAVSGYASRALFGKSGVAEFVQSRTARLLWPFLFGVTVIVPPQTWVELVTQHGYAGDYLHFYGWDYFRFGPLGGIMMPAWNHLWFVLYLWVYTLALASLALLPGKARLQRLFDRVFGGVRALILPALYVLLLEFVLFRGAQESQDLIHDGVAHLLYFPAFLFGFGLARSRPVMAGMARWWKLGAALAVASFATMAGLLIAWPNFSFPSAFVGDVFVFARWLETWTAITALIGFAETRLNRDHAWRPMLTEAVFPFYLIHQTVIVVTGYWLLPLGLGALAEFALLSVATVAGCWAFYLVGRRIDWLRPLIGLKRRPKVPAPRGRLGEPVRV